MQKTKRINVEMDENMKSTLERISRFTGNSQSSILRFAFRRYLKETEFEIKAKNEHFDTKLE